MLPNGAGYFFCHVFSILIFHPPNLLPNHHVSAQKAAGDAHKSPRLKLPFFTPKSTTYAPKYTCSEFLLCFPKLAFFIPKSPPNPPPTLNTHSLPQKSTCGAPKPDFPPKSASGSPNPFWVWSCPKIIIFYSQNILLGPKMSSPLPPNLGEFRGKIFGAFRAILAIFL